MQPESLAQADAELAGPAGSIGELRRALENDSFVLYCQPILALQGEARYAMAEVLVRMRQEEAALVPPGDFFPVLEHHRMMPELDRWVVRHAARHIARGSRIGRLSVNLSGQTLDDAEFARFVAGQIALHGLPPAALLFEIDERDTLLRPAAAARRRSAPSR